MATVFPVLGCIGILIILFLAATWLLHGREKIGKETRRRDKIRGLILRKLDPRQEFLRRHEESLVALVNEAEDELPGSYRRA